MTIGAGLILIAVGAILRFGISTVSTHGFGVHTIGDILMVVGAIGVVLWLLVWAPWAPRARSRRRVYREETRPVYREEVSPDDVPPARRYRTGATYEVDSAYEDEYRP
jgi:hypothetical protein